MAINFPKTEEDILEYWDEIKAFETQLKLTEDGPRFSFYDGPPFATGLPHYGHLLTSTIKDIIPRYMSMKGRHVVRCFGWDTHGLPVEYEIDKKLGISGRDAVMEMGVDRYNDECRAIVMRYAEERKRNIRRLGRWVDMENDYKALDVKFMESCWWVFKTLFDKGDVYRSFKIMPYSTALCTPLSHMESKQNEKMTQDPVVVVSFPLLDVQGRSDTSLVTYTTTPWTLPSNLFVAVHPDFEYMEILDEASGKKYITMQSGLAILYRDPKGQNTKYFADTYSDCFQKDYDAVAAAGFFGPERLPPCPVDDKGCFTAEVPDYAGQHVKASDKSILRDLRPTDRLLVESQTTHNDKFCWRSDTQLIRKAISSWFIRVENSVPLMLSNLDETSWASEDYEEVVCVGSIEELKQLSGYTGTIDDLHRDKIDHIIIPSKQGKEALRRVDEIFDCWFESGSMPYASVHYSFENQDQFHGGHFPADFIAEGLDQTRGWFYTLTVLGNKLFGVSPFRNVIVNGMAQSYRLYTVVPSLLRMIDDLTNWYIRFNRRRLKGGAGLGVEDTAAALNTLLQVLFTTVRALAPFTPFIAEHIYGLLQISLGETLPAFKDSRSVHFLPFPTAEEGLFDQEIERKVSVMPKVIQLGRVARERHNITLKTPLLRLVVVANSQSLSDLEPLKSYVHEELNVREVVLTSDESSYGIFLEAKVDWPTLGKKLKKVVQIVRKALPGLTHERLKVYRRKKTMTVEGIQLNENDLTIVRVMGNDTAEAANKQGQKWEPAFSDDLMVLLDVAPHPELMDEALVRDIINRVQRLRKKAGLVPTDDVRMQYAVLANPDGVDLGSVLSNQDDLFQSSLRGCLEECRDTREATDGGFILQEEQVLGNLKLLLKLLKLPFVGHWATGSEQFQGKFQIWFGTGRVVKWAADVTLGGNLREYGL
ncbi:Isoleucyl-tRNA synthetase [Cladobotryum mycophilum]|uniref:isoleucine--tRNA ligase n=1 Tax=Cladobotryum mycophilum TaxID=491253 RepID=A0ABR0SUN5_9HYPO